MLGFKPMLLSATLMIIGACQVDTTETLANSPRKSEPAKITANPGPKEQLISLRPATSNWNWDKKNAGIHLAAMPINHNGMTYVCGVRHAFGWDGRNLNASVMSAYKFYIDDEFISKGVNHFAVARSREDMRTTPVNCKSTNVAWSPKFERSSWQLRHSGTTSF